MNLKKIVIFAFLISIFCSCANAESQTTITSNLANVQISSTSSQVIDQIEKGTVVDILSQTSQWLNISYGNGNNGWIASSNVSNLASSSGTGIISSSGDSRLDSLVALAKHQLGKGYYDDQWPNTFTCNGFVTYLYLHIFDEARGLAVNLPCNGIYQADFCTYKIDAAQIRSHVQSGGKMDDYLKPGDIVYYHGVNWNKAGHVGMYIGNDESIESCGGTVSVKQKNLKEELLKGHLIFFCRIIDGNTVYTNTPGSQIRPLRRFPSELNINVYDYNTLTNSGVMVVDDSTPRNIYIK